MATQLGILIAAPFSQFLDTDGKPVEDGFLDVFVAKTLIPLTLYTNQLLTVPHPQAIPLDSSGRVAAYAVPGVGYKFRLRRQDGSVVWTQDDIIFGLTSQSAQAFPTWMLWLTW